MKEPSSWLFCCDDPEVEKLLAVTRKLVEVVSFCTVLLMVVESGEMPMVVASGDLLVVAGVASGDLPIVAGVESGGNHTFK